MKSKPLALIVMASCGILTAALQTSNAGTAKEDFNYPGGSEVFGREGGSGWVSPWQSFQGNGTIVTETGSLTYPGLATSGEKMHFTGVPGSGTTTVVYRFLSTPLTSGTTNYVRVLAQNLNDSARYFGLALFDGSTERMLLGQGSTFTTWTMNRVVITNNIATNTVVSTVDSSALALLVLKLELFDVDAVNTNGVERMTLWVNPDLSQPENLATAVNGTNYVTDRDFVQIDRVRIGGGGYSATAGGDPTEHYLDEIVISSVSPFAPKLSYMVAGGEITLSWPPEHLGWILQSQTGALNGGNWVDVPNTELVTSTTLPISPANPTEFFRLRPPQP